MPKQTVIINCPVLNEEKLDELLIEYLLRFGRAALFGPVYVPGEREWLIEKGLLTDGGNGIRGWADLQSHCLITERDYEIRDHAEKRNAELG